MNYNETLAKQVREKLMDCPDMEEKEMFGCLAFMVNGKLCICAQQDGLLLRIDPAQENDLLEKNGCREMKMGNRIMKGYVHVEEALLHTKKEFDYWTGLALDYNKYAKPAKQKTAKKSV